MKRTLLAAWLVLPFFLAGSLFAAPADGSVTDLEKMKLENERMKLENEHMKLEIEKQKLQTKPGPVDEGFSSKEKKDKDGLLARISETCAELAKGISQDNQRMVFDFNNGEMWYRGVRHSFNDMAELFDREKWEYKGVVVKRNSNGSARRIYAHKNITLLRYEHRDRGVFTWEASPEDEGFTFITPEGPGSESPYDEFRNAFMSEIFQYDKQRKKKNYRILRFKHRKGRFQFDDKLNIWFDENDRLVKIEWGVLDER